MKVHIVFVKQQPVYVSSDEADAHTWACRNLSASEEEDITIKSYIPNL